MRLKLGDWLIRIFAFAFTPSSKWHIVIQFCETAIRFIFHKVGPNAGTLGDEIIKAAYQELFTNSMVTAIAILLMHLCYGKQMRQAMHESSILPMEEQPKWIIWLRRIILLTRH